MPRRHRRNSRAAATSLTSLREQLAQEAARLMIEHGIDDYGHAKRKAAGRFGVTEAGALPSNVQVEACVAERQRIFEPDIHEGRLLQLRRLAASLMELLAPFHPRLVGPVLHGTATVNSPLELHLFSDAPEQVADALDHNGVDAQDCQRRLRFTAGESPTIVPGYCFTRNGQRVVALVFPEKGLRQAPLSPVDKRPMRRAGHAEVLALLG